MSEAEPTHERGSRGLSRRTFVKGAGLATGATVVGAGSAQLDMSPVRSARAVAPVLAAGYILAAGLVIEDEFNVLGSPDEENADDYRDLWLMADENRFLQSEIEKTVNNDIEGSANIARSEAYHSAFNSLNNGLSEQEAKSKARTRVQEYYRDVQRNVLTTWNRVGERAGYILTRAYQEGLIDSSRDGGTILRWQAWSDSDTQDNVFHDTSTEWKTWDDSTILESEYSNADEAGATTSEVVSLADDSETERVRTVGGIDLLDASAATEQETNSKRIRIDGYDGSTDRIDVGNGRELLDVYLQIEDKATSMANEAETIVSDIYTEYTAGEVDPTEYYSAIDMLDLYGVDDSGDMGSGAMSLAMQGYDTRLTRQVDITIDPYSDNPTTNSGILCLKRGQDSYSRSTPKYDEHLVASSTVPDGETRYSSDETKEDGKWVSSATYDGSQMSRRLVLVRQDGRQADLSSSVFSLDKITNLETGEEVSSMTLEDMGYQSSDPEKAAENVEKTKQAVTEIKVTTDGNLWGGGGGGLGGLGDFSVLGLGTLPSVGVVAGGAVALYGGVTAFAGGAAEGVASGLTGGSGGGGDSGGDKE